MNLHKLHSQKYKAATEAGKRAKANVSNDEIYYPAMDEMTRLMEEMRAITRISRKFMDVAETLDN